MKREKPAFNLTTALLSSATVICGLGCVITGFGFDITSFFPALLVLSGFGILCSLCAASKKAWHILLPAAVLLVIFLLWSKPFLISIETLLNRITRIYDGGYGWGYIRWSEHDLTGVSITPALILMGCVLIMPIHWTIHCRMWSGFGLIPGLIPLILCCVVTDTVPSPLFLIPLLVCLLLLVMAQLAQRLKHPNNRRLAAILLIPVFLFSLLLTVSCYGDGKEDQAQLLQDQLLDLLSRFADEDSPGLITVPGDPPSVVNLSALGPWDPGTATVMHLEVNHAGYLYLRGQSYDAYTGTSWASRHDTRQEGGWPTGGAFQEATLKISMQSTSTLRYFPYYLLDTDWTNYLTDGSYDNATYIKDYTFDWQIPLHTGLTSWQALTDAEEAVYLALPGDTRQAAQDILDEVFTRDGLTDKEKVELIRQYVENSARYDADTRSMPEDATDFAIWFLESGDTGYCVHFASAAAVLLRAAGIPARYVSGYISYAVPFTQVEVTAEQAHAWVEYLDPEQGWTVLEATPGAESIPEIPTTAPTETTQPTETTPPTETTQPIQTQPSTQPDAPTLPSSQTPTGPQATVPPSDSPGIQLPVREILTVLLTILGIWAVLAGQYSLRWNLRHRRLHQGSPKQQALRRWKYACRMAWLTRQKPPVHLRELAEKAAFSQHRLTRQELSQFDQWITETHKKLLSKPWPLRILLRLILAIK